MPPLRILSFPFRTSSGPAAGTGVGLLDAFFSRGATTTRQPTTLLSNLRNQRRRITTTILSRSSPKPAWRTNVFNRLRLRNPNPNTTRTNSSKAPHPEPPPPRQSQSLSARFKDLSRRYGRAAIWVYLGLSALDFPFCFLAVRLVGPERIGEVEGAIVDTFWRVAGVVMPSLKPAGESAEGDDGGADVVGAAEEMGPGRQAAGRHHSESSLATQALLAYGVHKSLIFFRVPLTAAVTPKIVKALRARGWNIGKPAASALKSK